MMDDAVLKIRLRLMGYLSSRRTSSQQAFANLLISFPALRAASCFPEPGLSHDSFRG